MKNLIVKTSENVKVNGTKVFLNVEEPTVISKNCWILNVPGFITDMNGNDVEVSWSLVPALLSREIFLLAAVRSATGWVIYLDVSRLGVNSMTEMKKFQSLLVGSVYDTTSLFRIRSDITNSGARIL